MESSTGGIGCLGLRAGGYSGRYPVAVCVDREVVRDICDGGGEGRGKTGGDTGARGVDEPNHHSEEPVGPSDEEGFTIQ